MAARAAVAAGALCVGFAMSLTANGAVAPNASAGAASGRRLFGAEGWERALTR